MVNEDNHKAMSEGTARKAVLKDSYAPMPNRNGRYTSGFSPLMMRIMFVNVLAVVTLAAGILYINQFRDNLVARQIESIRVQAEIIAGALGESAVRDMEASEVDIVPARQIISRLIGPTDQYAMLFRPEGTLIADSRYMSGNQKVVVDELPALDRDKSFKERGTAFLYWMLDWFAPIPNVPDHVDRPGMRAADFVEVEVALTGEQRVQLRKRDDGHLVINVATPVQRFRRVLGVLVVTAQTDDIEKIVKAEQLSILAVFGVAFAGTLFVAFFLGATIAKPIRILARSADRVRRGIGREERLPEFADRNDEIGDLSRALADMTRALYNQIDAVERFAADVAHELKNPLSSMRSALETLQMTKKPDVQARLMGILEEDVKRLDRLITDIADASRLDAELTRGRMSTVDLGQMFYTLKDAYTSTSCQDGPHIFLNSDEEGIFLIKGMEARLGQVWRNLIDNAITFTPKDKSIHINIEVSGKVLIVKIQDEGPGLPPGSEDKIFKRFYSERPSAEEFGKHSGLGLAISKQVIEAHDGVIVAENVIEDDHVLGACFTVRLPMTDGKGD